MMARVKELLVNGAARPVDVDEDRSLLSVLRDDLDLTGAKYGCGEGRCGACTVLVDGQAVRSCLARVGRVAGKADHDDRGPGDRTGGCTRSSRPSSTRRHAVRLLHARHDHGRRRPAREQPRPERAEIVVKAMDGNICRCGTYPRIVAAVRQAAAGDEGRCPMSDRIGRRPLARARALRARSPSRRRPLRARPPRLPRASLGGGLVVLCLSRDAEAPPSSRAAGGGAGPAAAPAPREIGAWLHIGEDGDRHGLHRQGRGRPEHPHVAHPGRGRGAARAARVGPPRDGRHGANARSTWAPSAAGPRRPWSAQLRKAAAAARERSDRPGRRRSGASTAPRSSSPTARSATATAAGRSASAS